MSQSTIAPPRHLSLASAISPPHQPQGNGAWQCRGWPWRVAAILGLFVVQGLWLTICFDTDSIAESSELWRELFRMAPVLPRIGISLLVVVPILGRKRILEHAYGFARAAGEHRRWPIWWLGQWSAFAMLTAASLVVFGDGAAGAGWAIVWMASAVATCCCCLWSLAPPRFCWQFAVRERWGLVAGVAIAACAAAGGRLFQRLWNPLGEPTFRLVEFWLGFLYSKSIVSDANQRLLGTDTFYVEIAPQCSGYEGIGLISIFVLAFLAAFRQTLRFPRAWLLWPLGVVAIWICNSLRIAALIVIGTEYSANLALGGFHSQAGWILFNLVSLGLMAAALQSRFFTRAEAGGVRDAQPVAPTLAAPAFIQADSYLLPFLALTALSMIMAALVDDPAPWYPLTVVVSLGALWVSRDLLRQTTWTWSPHAILHGIGVAVIWAGLAWLDPQRSDMSPAPLPTCTTIGGLTWTICRVFGAVVTVPIIEELAFRGFLMRRLVRSDFDQADYRTIALWAVLVTSVAFGVMHDFWIGGIIAGFSYAWVARRRNYLSDAIVAHAVTNALLALAVLGTGATWLW